MCVVCVHNVQCALFVFTGLLNKNRDRLFDNLTEVMETSSRSFISSLLTDPNAVKSKPSDKFRRKSKVIYATFQLLNSRFQPNCAGYPRLFLEGNSKLLFSLAANQELIVHAYYTPGTQNIYQCQQLVPVINYLIWCHLSEFTK